MKATLILTGLFITNFFFAQAKTILAKDIRINGLYFHSSKDEIIAAFGKPLKEFEPNYDCGFLSSQEQGVAYFTLQYQHVLFTGNKTEKYLLEEIIFDPKMNYRFTYKGISISSKIEQKTFCYFFGRQPSQNEYTVFFTGSDDALVVTFTNNNLTQITYWSPC